MSMINTDKKLIAEFLDRAVENIYPTKKDLEKKLNSGERLSIYTGVDPTGDLHLGHATVFRKLAKLQKMGHKVIVLIGTFTAKIGDPTDKMAARKTLSDEEIAVNMKDYKKQLAGIINFDDKKNPVEVVYNADWLSKLTFEEVIKLASHFTVQQMLERDMFQKRLQAQKPIYFHEFMYPLMQGYDSVVLNVDMEIGGNDQTFNMLAGRTLLKAMKGKEKFVMTMELLVDDKGVKMSKTDSNFVALSNSPEDMYGKVMSWTDSMIENAFRVLTDVIESEVKKLKKDLKNPRDLKMKLAYEVVRLYKGEAEANLAQDNFVRVFSNKEKPSEIEEKFITSKNIIEALIESGLISSKGEARRLIDQKGVKVDDEIVAAYDFELKKGRSLVQKGKRHFIYLSVE